MTHILVVDPNEAFATLLSEELKRQGYGVVMCSSGSDALAAAAEQTPDLTLLDMALEEPDALTVAMQLREQFEDIRLMLIPLIGEDLPTEAAEAVSVQGVLPKPFFLPELPERIEAALNVTIGDPHVAFTPKSTEYDAPAAPEPTPEPEVTSPVKPAVAVAPAATAPAPAPVVESADESLLVPGGGEEDVGLSYDAFTVNRKRVEGLMSNLAHEVGADAVLLTYGGGLLAWVGGLERNEAESISRAVIHGWRTSAEVARILGQQQVRFEQSIAGGNYMLYALSVEVNAIMAVVVKGSSTLGLLRHRARSTAERITQLCVK